ncbi:hypothetical protein A0T30_04585 [Aquipseudomonas alcaligenes]|nr:hypothetical protein A0T30_04585 [Pseudomonas alcaligenes]
MVIDEQIGFAGALKAVTVGFGTWFQIGVCILPGLQLGVVPPAQWRAQPPDQIVRAIGWGQFRQIVAAIGGRAVVGI